MGIKELQDSIDMFNEAMDKDEKPIREIAHYTDVNAFVAIADTKYNDGNQSFVHFWFVDGFCTNDKNEIKLGYDFMIDKFSEFEECIINRDDRCLVTKYPEELKKSKRFERYTQEDIKNWLIRNEATPYVMSLSRKIDDTDMWLKYGNGGKGVCVIFDFKDIENYRDQSDFRLHGPFSVVYKNCFGYTNELLMLKKIVLMEYERFLNDVIALKDFDEILERKIKAMDQVCGLISSFIKSKEWHTECEERMVALRHFLPIKDPSLNIANNNGINHVEINIPTSCIKKVFVGPCVSNADRERIRESASKIGMKPSDIEKSSSPIQ